MLQGILNSVDKLPAQKLQGGDVDRHGRLKARIKPFPHLLRPRVATIGRLRQSCGVFGMARIASEEQPRSDVAR